MRLCVYLLNSNERRGDGMDAKVIETIEREAIEATIRFANKFRNGGFDKFESHNHGPNYEEAQNGSSSSMLNEDEKSFMEFLSTPFAKKIMGLE